MSSEIVVRSKRCPPAHPVPSRGDRSDATAAVERQRNASASRLLAALGMADQTPTA
jgi:hypothetical protein